MSPQFRAGGLDVGQVLTDTIADRVRRRLTLPGLREESVKIGSGRVERGRYLLSFARRALLPGPKARFLALAEDLSLDATALLSELSAACAVHVGIEADGRAKLYLEFPETLAPAPGLVFLAVKHDAHVNRYTRTFRAAQLLHGLLPDSPARATALACLPTGGATLHVTEDGGLRSSIDIHLADTGMLVRDLPGLDALVAGYDDDLADIRDEVLGHFAAGIGRDGQPFCTIYYGGRYDP